MGLRILLRPHKEGIAALEEDGFTVKPVRFSRGDHLIVMVSKDGSTCKVTLSGSPSGLFLHSLVCAARRGIREARNR
ncbi:hypothetical protein P9A54_gp60 [Xanthomonas phage vB_Xar_IVIA-DoCa10]|uniref:Uncharacterized protein n=1 Tax=Xanthomonas phage vB_Xar_IVIA-DoCa10 TaxID=2975529 RepID=A0A9X9JND6_9CAUD|nr:hypothetical protein P9A54_gp60 [Xanthomonas phage vB_Xar_IVIA-DoCa10]UYA99045.1 hypothetical protein IVIADoCa10_60 [Xanthomonas phage vB_Xar_IVIA-DoCa10]